MTITPSAAVRIAALATSAVAVAATAVVKLVLDKPRGTYRNETEYENTVMEEYDEWADDGILEYYWGEHIHLGYYGPGEGGLFPKKNFIKAKYEFIDEMMKFGGIEKNSATSKPLKVLDVGCGFGGTSRYLAKNLGPKAHVTGITLSPNQAQKGAELAQEQGVGDRTKFLVMDALKMTFEDNTFDIVWACESGEHMPDKKKYIEQMMRVLKPGGTFVMACWCERDETPGQPFTKRDRRDLQYLYEEWSHPYFISISKFQELIEQTGVMSTPVTTANWVKETIASWRHSILVGIIDPRGWIFKPRQYFKCVRDAYCLERMHRAFQRGLMEYGMWTATKKKQSTDAAATTEEAVALPAEPSS
ncbi:hypothetical protein ACA910_001467 [Epithemia clementina (nom. ined.)]